MRKLIFDAGPLITALQERYQRYRRGEISLGRLAQELGVTSWELTHLLDSYGWPEYNLPEADQHPQDHD
jgi:hypothetical protein